MIIEKVILVCYLFTSMVLYLRVSKKNHSFLNSYTIETANELFIRLCPLILTLDHYRNMNEAVRYFCIILYGTAICKYIGYMCGYKTKLNIFKIEPQYYAIKKYRILFKAAIAVGIISFLLLGVNGVGVKAWIVNPRLSYMQGRIGNGIFYVLFQLSLIVSIILTICDSFYHRKERNKFIWIVMASYFTGSKMLMLGIILIYIYYRDMCIKKISMKNVVCLGIIGMVGLIMLLSIQSGISLLKYSDYYSNFLRLIEYSKGKNWNYFRGDILKENLIWSMIPRKLYNNKPYIYGYSRIINIFYNEAIIKAGNTPSFSQFAIAYADFGIVGTYISFFMKGLFKGVVEKYLRFNIEKRGTNFNMFFLYSVLFVVSPLNFGFIFLMIFLCFMNIIQKIYFRIRIKAA